jgi:autotransporter-associated beta strand protein
MRRAVLLTAFALFTVSPLIGATRTWSGAVSGSWSDPSNWNGVTPVAGDDLSFPAAGANKVTTNDLSAGTLYNSLSFSGSGYNIFGNAIVLGGGGITSTSGGNVALPITLAADQGWSVIDGSLSVSGGLAGINLGGHTLSLNAVPPGSGTMTSVAGSGRIVKIAGGSWLIGGNNTFTGQVLVTEGTLTASGGTPLGVGDDTVANGTIVSSGATLSVQGDFAPEYLRLFGGGAEGAGALAGNGTLPGTVELGDQSVMIRGGTLTLNGLVTGSGRLGLGNSLLILGHSHNDFTGPVMWDPSRSATLRLAAADALPPGIAIDIPLSSSFDLNGYSQTIRSLQGAGRVSLGFASGGTLTITGPATTTFSGIIDDGEGTVHQSGGVMTLTGLINFTGAYNLSGGTLQLRGRLGLASLNQSGGTFRIADDGFAKSVTVSGGTFEPGGGPTVPRIETLTLTPAATYSEIIDTMVPENTGRIEATASVDLGGSKLRISGNLAGLTRFFGVAMIQTNNSSLALSGQFPPPFTVAGFDFAVDYNPGTSFPVRLGVLGKPTETTLTSSANPSVAGDEVTFTATVTAPPGETFSNGVTFKDGLENLAFAAIDGSGVATYSTHTLDIGSHVIQARYNGNDILAESTSPELTQSILATAPPPAVTFDAVPAIVMAGQSSILVWTTTFATAVTIDNDLGAQALSGSLMVHPAATTTYMLTATGAGGTTVRTLTITVATGRRRAVRH